MPLVTVLTMPNLTYDDPEIPLLSRALAALGIDMRVTVWSDAAAFAESSDLVVIHSTWNYQDSLADFLRVLRNSAVPVENPVDIVEWNSHKGYLVELADAGVPVVPTTMFHVGDEPDLGGALVGDAGLVIKPAVSASAQGLARFDLVGAAAQAHLELLLTTGDVLVQPFQTAIAGGETSLIYLGGVYSHAVRKSPADGDFRVQEQFGGTAVAHEATDGELMVADAALAQVQAELLYARVDVVDGPDGPLLMELELIEPYLFLAEAPGSADRFAAAIARRLGP